jgi:transcriptional regulator with XRE-family HTH domain
VSGMQSPTVRRRRVAFELRRLREAAKLTCEDVATRLECSASKISRIETGRVTVSPRDVRDLLRIYGVPVDQQDSLIQLARESRQKGWWHAFGDSVEPQMTTYLGLENAASELRIYRVSGMHGLLRTENYARAVINAGRVGAEHPGTEQSVRVLLERQRQASARLPRLWAVLDEGALRRHVGGRAVMREQIEHLVGLSAQPGMFIQVLPYSSGLHIAMNVSFTLMAFADPADSDVVCIGYPTGLLWIEETAEVDRYNALFHHMQAAALSPSDSAELMISVLKEL